MTGRIGPDRLVIAAGLLAAVIVLLIQVRYYYPFYGDDAYISLRYAQRLLAGKGLTWNDGERVEGYSNLLWILLAAGMGKIGFNLVTATLWLGLAATISTFMVFIRFGRRQQCPLFALVAGLLAYALSAPVAIWSIGGLEAPLVMALFAWSVLLAFRLIDCADNRIAAAIGILLGLICLLRPEGPLYTAAVMLAVFLTSSLPLKLRLRTAFTIGGIAFCFFAAQLAFRLNYYGTWVSNSALAKVAFSSQRLVTGTHYIFDALFSFIIPLSYSVFIFRRAGFIPPAIRLAAIAGGLWCVAVIVGGGDMFEGFRMFLPVVPLIVMAFMQAASLALPKAAPRKEYIFLLCLLLCHGWLQSITRDNEEAKLRHGEAAAKLVGQALAERFGATRPLIAVGAAGAVPYYSGLPALDVFGLNDAYLTAHRYQNPNFGKGKIGHELFDADYIKMRKPDILVFDLPQLGSQCAINDCKDLLNDYRKDTLVIPGYRIPIWLRKGSAKVR